MKIGIDAARLKRKDRTGTENYLYFLLTELFKLDSKNDYVLYFDSIPSPLLLAELGVDNKRIKYKVLKKILSWTQISLSFELFRNPPDILYCSWHTMPGFYPFWKTKVFSVIHDITGRIIPTFWTITFSNKLIAVSESTKSDIVKRYRCNPAKIVVIGEGYDSKEFYPRSLTEVLQAKSKYGIEGDYVFFVGSLSERKNIVNMIEAFNKLNSPLTFVLGGSPLKGYEYMTKLSAKFIGRVDPNDLAALYTGAKMFMYVSKEEGFGIPILEAMACCVPVLTSNNSATKELAGDAALLVDPNSVSDISEGIKRLLTDADLVTVLVHKGMKRHLLFSWEDAATKTLGLFERESNA